MVSLAALVLTITMVVVQLAMGQFSPRIVQTFLRDRPSQLAIGLFVATFAHAMLAMREVQFDGDGQVPGIAIVVGYVLVLTSIAMLVLYVHHIGRSLRVSALIELVGNDTRTPARRAVPRRCGSSTTMPTRRDRRTQVRRRDRRRPRPARRARRRGRLRAARRAGARGLRAGRGAADPHRGRLPPVDRTRCATTLRSGLERTLDEDVAYGFRMLVDMAERALSESPVPRPDDRGAGASTGSTTGCASSRVRELPTGGTTTTTGRLRLTVPAMDWDAYVHLAFDEIRLAGADRRRSAAGWWLRWRT